MKVLILNSYQNKGGAARAAVRLAEALPHAGVEVQYKCLFPTVMSPTEKAAWLTRVLYDRVPALLAAGRKVHFSSHAPRNRELVRWINQSDADLVHLHWLNGGGMSVKDFKDIEKPMVWTLHDMWAFTGGCHYDNGCERYRQGCGACPTLHSSRMGDMSARLAQSKRQIYRELTHLSVVGVSDWVASCAAASSSMAGLHIQSLPNPIDTDRFAPMDKGEARRSLGLSQTRKIVLFGAMAAVDDKRKGFHKLLGALRQLNLSQHGVELAIFGSEAPTNGPALGYPARYYGHVGDDMLRTLYSAADVMVAPSLQETFGQTVSEAMACGTPVVAFGATGLLDIVDHKRNGFLASPYEEASLAEGIEWVLRHADPVGLGIAARKKVVDAFRSEVVAERYRDFYKGCLERFHAAPSTDKRRAAIPLSVKPAEKNFL